MNVDEYLNNRVAKTSGKIADTWKQLQELYSKKLWHPLINKLKECVNDLEFMKDQNVIEMHDKFIKEFEHRTNPLTLTEIIIVMAKRITNIDDAVKFIESIKNVVKNHGEASVLFLVVKVLLDEAQHKLNYLNGVTTVHGPFYKCNSMYLREIGDYAAYYRDALRYLGCIDLSKLTSEDKSFQAFCLGIAALLGEDIYNFGELLAHPILDAMKGTSYYYIVDLLNAFNAGDLKKFDYLRNHWIKQNDLALQAKSLEKKIQLMALVELAFSLLTSGRKLSFDEISKRSGVKIDAVEFLVMKALALKLIKGSINEIERTVEISWVQPRVLDKKSISSMSTKFDHWGKETKKVADFVNDQAREILTQVE
uniref:26S proteasome non-ATPase regulatory subunit 13 n=1 Tax=Romanomermis culicivorax TaxID=13658 RepID=A0A915IS60_ROMCU